MTNGRDTVRVQPPDMLTVIHDQARRLMDMELVMASLKRQLTEAHAKIIELEASLGKEKGGAAEEGQKQKGSQQEHSRTGS